MSTLRDFSSEISETAAATARFVAAVSGSGTRFGASGLIWQPGVVVTTRSSLRRDDQLRLTLPDNDGEPVAATLAGHDPGTDLAVLRFEATDTTEAARPVLAAGARLGEVILAVGRAWNTGANVALGLVSAVGQPWQTWQGGRIDSYLRLDVNLYPGCSGAAIVNASGELLGIATGAMSRIAPLAIPSATVERVVNQLLARGRVARPWLGVGVQAVPIPTTLAQAAESLTQGLVVLSADPGTPAGDAGILVGDVLLRVAGSAVEDPMDLRSVLSGLAPGDTVAVVLLRGGERREISVQLGEKVKKQA